MCIRDSDKDVSYGTKLVEPHVHAYIDFPKLIDLSKVASALGLERERIETPKSKGGRAYTRINALAYLIHAKDKDKYQYPANDVETFDTLDYETFINQNKEDFEKYSATKNREKSDESLDLVLGKVYKGELTYSASSKNPFDNYAGEEILILDDLREDSLSATDWLKLFDPVNSARMSARYRNKLVVPRLVIMSAYMSPKQFFGKIETEDINQYLHRVNYSSEIARKHGMEERFYSVAEVKENKANGYYQRSDGTSVVLNFDYEDLFSVQDKGAFITKLLAEYIYPRILPKKAKDVTND